MTGTSQAGSAPRSPPTPAELAEIRTSLIGRYAARRREFVTRGLARMREVLPAGDPDAERPMEQALEANFDNAVERVRLSIARGEPGSGPPAIEAVAGAHFTARAGISLNALTRAYRIAHAVSWDILADEIARLPITTEQRAVLSRMASQMSFDYNDELIELVTREYTHEAQRRARGREQRRDAALTRILAGEDGDPSGDLGYELDDWHIAAVVDGLAPEAFARALATASGRRALIVSRSAQRAWVWLGGRVRFEASTWRRLAERVSGGEARVAFGEPAHGVEGFRLSHSQAQAADRVAQLRPAPLTRYADVALLAIVLADEQAAHALVHACLPPLQVDGERGRVLTETLRAYFSCSLNATSAAARLGVSERTVRNHLRTLEELLGYPIDSRRPALEIALELRELNGWSE